MPLDTGRYFIRNVEHGNVVVLQGPFVNSMIVGRVPELDSHHKATEWNIILLKNQQYLIQNYEHDLYVGSTDLNDNKPSLHGTERLQRWLLVETAAENRYTISPADQLSLFWSLEDEDDESLVTLSSHAMALTSRWQFERVYDLDSCIGKLRSDRKSIWLRGLQELLRFSLQVEHLQTFIHDGGLAALVALTSDPNPEMQIIATETMDTFIQGAFALLMADLHSWDPIAAQVVSLNTVAQLASMGDAREVAVRYGMVQRLVRLLAAEDVTIQARAAGALLAITVYEPAVDVAGRAGAMEALERIIGANGKAKAIATAVLKNLSGYTASKEIFQTTEPRLGEGKSEPELGDEIVRSMTALVKQIEGNDVSLYGDATLAIWDASIDVIKAEAAIDAGVVLPLIKLLGSADTVTRRNTTGAFRSLVLRPRARLTLLERDTIPTFAKLFNDSDFNTSRNAIICIHNLAGCGVDAANACLDADVVPPLIELLSSNVTLTVGVASGAIWVLTMHAAGRIRFYDAGVVPMLAKLLGHEASAVRCHAVGALQYITLHPPATEAFMRQDCLPALFKLFTDDLDHTRIYSSATVVNITQHESARAKVCDAGALPALVKVLYSDNAEQREFAAGAIRNVTLYPPAQAISIDSGAVAGFRYVLALADTKAFSNSVAAIRAISADQGAIEALFEGGMVPVLVRMLGSKDLDVVEHAAAALRNITLHQPTHVVCLSSGAVRRSCTHWFPPALAQHILTSSNTRILFESLKCMRNIAYHKATCQAVLDTGLIPFLAQLLENEDQGTRAATAGLMRSVLGNIPAKRAALNAGAIRPLMKLLKSQDTTERRDAVAALWSVVGYGPAQEVATNAGSLPLLIPLLGPSHDITTRDYAAGAIQNIALYARAQLICVELGALSLLSDLIAHPNITARTNAAIAVWSIAAYGVVAWQAILEAGVIESLVAMMRECSGDSLGEYGRGKALVTLRRTFEHIPCRKRARSLGALPLLKQILAAGYVASHDDARGAISDIAESTSAADDPSPGKGSNLGGSGGGSKRMSKISNLFKKN